MLLTWKTTLLNCSYYEDVSNFLFNHIKYTYEDTTNNNVVLAKYTSEYGIKTIDLYVVKK